MKLKSVLSTSFLLASSFAVANPYSAHHEEPSYLDFIELKVSMGKEQLFPEYDDHPINFSLGLETAKWYGFYLAGSYEHERTSLPNIDYSRNEWHGQLGYKLELYRVFAGLQVGMFSGTEYYSTSGGVEMEYSSHGIEGTLYAGVYLFDNWTLRGNLKPKSFRDGLVTDAEALIEYRIAKNWSAQGFYNILFKDLEYLDHQTSFGVGVKYHF